MQEEAIQKILRYSQKVLFDPGPNWPRAMVQKRAYERWATNEILSAIMDQPFKAPDMVIDEFILKMEYFLHISECTTANKMFSTAEDTAEDILNLILS